MKSLIGGLFKTQENANLAYQALEKSGFASEEIHMFVHKPRRKTARSTDVRIQDVAKNAFFGGLIGSLIGGFVGFLVGSGILPLPYLEPGLVERNVLFVTLSVLWGLVAGGLTGMILGVASKLLRSREKAEVMTRQIEKNGVLVTVSVDGTQREASARRVMEAHEALEVGNPSEKWDLEAWASPNEMSPSLKNLANTR
jgi:outer membrane lipoprotein SlyB